DVLRLYHFRPARLLRVDVDIWRGYYTVVKLEEFQVRGGDFAGSCKFTPFERRSLYGRVVATAVGGRLFTEFFT
ncbi:MAG: dihydroorotase, partial [Pyrobaculum sp.]